MYPMLKQGVSMGTFSYEGSDDEHYFIENADGDEFEISSRIYNALLKADGTKPLDLPGRGRSILPSLKKNGLVQTSRFVNDGILNRFILKKFGKFSRSAIRTCKMLNKLLPFAAVLFFAIGIVLMLNVKRRVSFGFDFPFHLILVYASIALHELGHLTAGVAYGYTITDAGILLLWRIPIGGYVAHDENTRVADLQRLQISLAGVEMNILLAGILLIASVVSRRLSLTFASTANVNVILAIVNGLIPSFGLDGESALSALLGVRSIYELSRKWIKVKDKRRKLLKAGFPGVLCFGFFSIVYLSKVLVWAYLGLNVFLAIAGIVL